MSSGPLQEQYLLLLRSFLCSLQICMCGSCTSCDWLFSPLFPRGNPFVLIRLCCCHAQVTDRSTLRYEGFILVYMRMTVGKSRWQFVTLYHNSFVTLYPQSKQGEMNAAAHPASSLFEDFTHVYKVFLFLCPPVFHRCPSISLTHISCP